MYLSQSMAKYWRLELVFLGRSSRVSDLHALRFSVLPPVTHSTDRLVRTNRSARYHRQPNAQRDFFRITPPPPAAYRCVITSTTLPPSRPPPHNGQQHTVHVLFSCISSPPTGLLSPSTLPPTHHPAARRFPSPFPLDSRAPGATPPADHLECRRQLYSMRREKPGVEDGDGGGGSGAEIKGTRSKFTATPQNAARQHVVPPDRGTRRERVSFHAVVVVVCLQGPRLRCHLTISSPGIIGGQDNFMARCP